MVFTCVLLFVLLVLPTSLVGDDSGSRIGPQFMTGDLEMIAKPGDYKRSLTHDGRERSYLLHIPPAYRSGKPLPLVIMLHGGGGNAENAARMTGLSSKADKEGFIVVYPNGTGQLKSGLLTWNAGHCCGYAFEKKVDDVGFIKTLIERLQRQFDIDSKRIYATGMSNGAMMAYQLGCKLSDMIAAIALIAGSFGVENCQPEFPLSVIIFHGTADEHVLYEGSKSKKSLDKRERVDRPVSYAVSFWVKHNDCSTIPQRQGKGNIIQETYTGFRDGVEVVLYTIKGGGHAWPGRKKGRFEGDESTQEISATYLMRDFFIWHPKR